MHPAIQQPHTFLPTREVLVAAAADVPHLPAKASGFDRLRTTRAGAGVAQQQAPMAAIRVQQLLTDLAAGMRQRPRIIRGRVLEPAAEAEVGLGDERLRVRGSTFGTGPRGGLGLVEEALLGP